MVASPIAPSSSLNLKEVLLPCLESLRKNFIPGLFLQAFAVGLILAYYFYEPVGGALDVLGALKLKYGYLYSAVSTSLCGGLLPYLVLLYSGAIPKNMRVSHGLFYVLFWVVKGMEVDALYRAQGMIFGYDNTVAVVSVKVAVDQFLFVPLWMAPTQVLGFLFKDSDFSVGKMKQAFAEQSFFQRYLTVVLSTWMVWLPAVAVIYALPSSLQIPLFNIVLCFWCLLMSYISLHKAK